MAWNGSNKVDDKNDAVTKGATEVSRPRSKLHGAIAGLVVVVGAGIAAWMIFGRGPNKSAEDDRNAAKSAAIMDVGSNVTAKTQTNAPPAPIDKSKLSKAWQQYYDGRDTNKWMVVSNRVTHQEYISRIVHPGPKNQKLPLYKAHALNILDAIVFKPISNPMTAVRIDDRYMKSLQEGLIEKITINEDDPDDVKERKQGMIDLQKDLQQRLKNGEDLQQLISDSLKERNNVAALKQAMVSERAKMRREGASEEDIETYTELCNKRLTERGASPMVSRSQLIKRIHEKALERENGNDD